MSGWVMQALIASTLLMLLVLVLRRPVARLFGPRAAYALWALPALRLAMPPLPGWHVLYVPVLRLSGPDAAVGLVDPLSAAHFAARDAALAAAPGLPVQPETIPVAALLVAAWLTGAVLWFGWQMLGYRGFLDRALAQAVPLTRVCGVEVLLTPAVDGPVAAGVLRRRIFLPADFLDRYGPEERRLALLHEGAHHDRRDILANLAALAVVALHWWNPVAHRAYRVFRADQELACDATLLAEIRAGERHAYGSAMLKSASARVPGTACALSHKDELRNRLRTMARPVIGGARLRIGGAIVLAAIAGGLVATASGEANTIAPQALVADADDAAIRADAAAVREDGEREARDARRDAEHARRDALRAAEDSRRDALRIADEARRAGLRAAAQARRAGEDERRDALREAVERREEVRAAWNERDEGARQVALVRHEMAARCAAAGRPVSPDLDWSRLALCGDSGAAIAARARADVARELAD